MSVMIGIDPHKGSHAAAAVGSGEQVIAEIEVRSTKRQSRELLAWAQRLPGEAVGDRVRQRPRARTYWPNGLVAAGEQVLDVPATQAARVRVLDSAQVPEERRQ